MTPALHKALALHQPLAEMPKFPSDEERAAVIALNARRASITDDDWPKKIAAFRNLFDLAKHNRSEIGLLLRPRMELHAAMLIEEQSELLGAIVENNLPEIVDGILDLIYVGLGTLAEIGLTPAQINLLMEEVHASNMTKTDDEGKPIYSDTGKVLKGPNYVKADIAGLLLEWGWKGSDNG